MKTPYQILGEDGIKELANAFYDTMEEAHSAAGVRRMHAEDLSPMKLKLAEYLTGWMGGPPIYSEKYGTVCMTEPHAPYAIGPRERDQWLLCMDAALEKIDASDELKDMLKTPMYRIASAIQNMDTSLEDRKEDDDNLIAIG
ncbi:MAG: group II truncated hemoglobin [Pseudomonadales bacterium]